MWMWSDVYDIYTLYESKKEGGGGGGQIFEEQEIYL